ncbi:MAG: VRR-NUC domain-containing protein [Clostridiales bacterium]|nr:VRR-NUC domain-containing protein [Clostridiales bacterium]
MLEKEVERRMGEMVKKRGGQFYKFMSPGMPGVPDRILIVPGGKIWFVELKQIVGTLSGIQKWVLGELERMGCNVRVIRGWDDAKTFVAEVFKDAV